MISAKLVTPPPSLLLPPSPRLHGRRLSPTAASSLPDPALPLSSRPDLDREDTGRARPEEEAAAAAVSYPPLSPAQRASSQLSRWSRARALRSGRRLEWPTIRGRGALSLAPTKSPSLSEEEAAAKVVAVEEDVEDDEVVGVGREAAGKSIYMVSDGTGWTVEHSVNAALGQFENCLVDRGCAVSTHLFSG